MRKLAMSGGPTTNMMTSIDEVAKVSNDAATDRRASETAVTATMAMTPSSASSVTTTSRQ